MTTPCMHFRLLPIFPLGSRLVLTGNHAVLEYPIRLSFRSLFVNALRAATLAISILSFLLCIGSALGTNFFWKLTAALFVLGLLAAGLFQAIKIWGPFRWASYSRAIQLAERAKVPLEVFVQIEEKFGRVTPEEADLTIRKMAKLKASSK